MGLRSQHNDAEKPTKRTGGSSSVSSRKEVTKRKPTKRKPNKRDMSADKADQPAQASAGEAVPSTAQASAHETSLPTAHQDAAQQESARQDIAHQAVDQQGVVRQAAERQNNLHQDSAKQKSVHQDVVQQDSVNTGVSDVAQAEAPVSSVKADAATPEHANISDADSAAELEEDAALADEFDSESEHSSRRGTVREKHTDTPTHKSKSKHKSTRVHKNAWSLRRKVVTAVVAVMLVAVVGCTSAFVYHRWFAFDDAADFQGVWYIAGTDEPIEITADEIVLAEDVAYNYTLNAQDKTIDISFSTLEGGGHYRFSLDRNQLAVVDGTWEGGSTLLSDAGWIIQAIMSSIQGVQLSPAEQGAENTTLLTREPTSRVQDERVPHALSDENASSSSASSASDASSTSDDASTGDNAGTGETSGTSDESSTSDDMSANDVADGQPIEDDDNIA